MWGHPPLCLLLLCLSVFLTRPSPAYAKPGRRCRLKPRNQRVLALQPPTNTSPATASPTSNTGTPNPIIPPPNTSNTTTPSPDPHSFSYGKTPIRGVNLGGWLMMEPWITPSMFEKTGNDDIVDEYTFGKLQDGDKARQMLKEHWETWITEDDFAQIAAAGLNHVRLPIAYWAIPVDDTPVTPYISGGYPYMLKALTWAANHGISVILDLHGAPGSQNGFDNSGQRTGSPVWGSTPDNIQRTVDIIRFLAKDVGDKVAAIELLNEPAGFRSQDWANAIRDYWSKGYKAVRDTAGNDVKVMIGDGFLTVNSWTGFLKPPDGVGVMMDVHAYQIFSVPELKRSHDDHIANTCAMIPTHTTFANQNIWTVFGEWSAAPTDCTKWLNGRGVGARWDGTYDSNPGLGSCDGMSGSWKTFSDDYKAFLRKYWEAQVELGERVQGWVYWTWKAENSDEWSYQKGLEAGWIPKSPDDRMYPNVCG